MSGHRDPWREDEHTSLADALPVDFTAFVLQRQPAYLRYAHLFLGTREEAQDVVEEALANLLRTWRRALSQASIDAYALSELKEAIGRRLAITGRQPAIVETAAFTAARETIRDQLHALESTLGLYSAIARLPERQLDVILLGFVVGLPLPQVAQLMGVCDGTVRTHLHAARRRLATDLHLDLHEKERAR